MRWIVVLGIAWGGVLGCSGATGTAEGTAGGTSVGGESSGACVAAAENLVRLGCYPDPSTLGSLPDGGSTTLADYGSALDKCSRALLQSDGGAVYDCACLSTLVSRPQGSTAGRPTPCGFDGDYFCGTGFLESCSLRP